MIFSEIEKNDEAAVEQFSLIAELIPILYEVYGRGISSGVSSYILLEPLRRQLEKKVLTGFTFNACLKYALAKMEVGNYRGGDFGRCLGVILPMLYNRGEYQKGYDLALDVIKHNFIGGSVVYWKNEFESKLSKYSRLKVSDFERIEMSTASRSASGNMRVYRLINAFDQIWGINSHLYINGAHGQAFRLSPNAKEVSFLSQVDGLVSGLDVSPDFVAISTIDSGVFLLDRTGRITKKYTINNSLLPSNEVGSVCSDGESFYLGIIGKDPHNMMIHKLDPKQGILKSTQNSIQNIYPIRCFEGLVIKQNSQHRTRLVGDVNLEFKHHYSMAKTVTDHYGNRLMTYEGVELRGVSDFVLWQDLLVFADSSGLYVSKSGSNQLQCSLSEKDLKIFSLCVVDQLLFLGTSDGLFRIDYDTFRKGIK